ncbi:hypothetical protein HAZT_HAZT004568 [Hyalella azteca]|uniref:Uncharacterized protein n=1 Tax=Hyalella azteca TaxID=294128 RepID=A0A6A0HGD1_HYAAZ|nr:hypothetical protein HAZT_HAZT004568 [Hyalella azteca]
MKSQRRGYCATDKYKQIDHEKKIKETVRSIDPDLVRFLSSRIYPLSFMTFENKVKENILNTAVQHFCNATISDIIAKRDCESNSREFLGFLVPDKVSKLNGEKNRERRQAETDVNAERSGYGDVGAYGGGYGGSGGYGGYDDSSYIVVPDEDDKSGSKHLYLIKLLAAWAFGAYCLLGLLAYQTYFATALTNGTPGAKGASGASGDKGLKGDKGMSGDKGMKGDTNPGMIGDPGDKGMKGIKGFKGFKGMKGPVGPAGPTGPKGVKGSPGQNNGAPGPAGPKGPKGNQGAQGGMGAQGPSGRKKRSVKTLIKESNIYNVDLTDSARLLDTLYATKDESSKRHSASEKHIQFAEMMNKLWREFKNPFGCLRCVLFDLLHTSEAASADPYIM